MLAEIYDTTSNGRNCQTIQTFRQRFNNFSSADHLESEAVDVAIESYMLLNSINVHFDYSIGMYSMLAIVSSTKKGGS